jgi:hypothetical protein
MYRYVVARRGPLFGLFFAAVHYVVNVTIGAAVVTGMAQWVCSASFRRAYDAAGPLAGA